MTVSFYPIPNFDQYTKPEAQNVIYNQLIPACEKAGVYLSQAGNHNSHDPMHLLHWIPHTNHYWKMKEQRSLLDVDRIQRCVASLDLYVKPTKSFINSYALKHYVEELQKEYISDGDLTAAMLIKGYFAIYQPNQSGLQTHCFFRAEVVDPVHIGD